MTTNSSPSQSELSARETAESTVLYPAIFDNIPIAIVLTKMPERVFVHVNEPFTELFGFARNELSGKTSVDLGISQPEQQEYIQKQLEVVGQVRDMEIARKGKDGRDRYLSINIDPLTIDGIKYVLTSIQDITERKELEKNKADFIASLAHNLRNPLAAVLSHAELLRHIQGDDATKSVDAIERNAKAMAKLLDELLDAAKISSSKSA